MQEDGPLKKEEVEATVKVVAGESDGGKEIEHLLCEICWGKGEGKNCQIHC